MIKLFVNKTKPLNKCAHRAIFERISSTKRAIFLQMDLWLVHLMQHLPAKDPWHCLLRKNSSNNLLARAIFLPVEIETAEDKKEEDLQ